MKKTRFAAKAFAGTVATTLLVLGSLAGPADAARDTGWGKTSQSTSDLGSGKDSQSARDTGWG